MLFDLILFSFKFFNFPKPEAARSLAIPLTPRQSGLLGVIDRSIRLETDFENIYRVTEFYDKVTLFSGRVLVAMRYHACVWAAMRGIPFLALSYDPKVTALARSLNQEVIDIQKGSIDLNDYSKTLKRVYEQAEIYHQRLKEVLPEKIKQAEYHREVFR